jgi:hypothetical protein
MKLFYQLISRSLRNFSYKSEVQTNNILKNSPSAPKNTLFPHYKHQLLGYLSLIVCNVQLVYRYVL